jgi:hypothetical protein
MMLPDRSVVILFEDQIGDKFHPPGLPWRPSANPWSFGDVSIEFLTIFYLCDSFSLVQDEISEK